MAPKSILKNRSSQQPSDGETASKEQRHRDIALHHATIIQQQKDIESRIFESLLQLIDLPLTPNADPAEPSAADLASLRSNLELFQQSDFDAVVEERQANGQCGYVLCPRLHRKENSTAKFRIIRNASDMKIVPRESLETWCSDACAKRAAYIKVQLPDEPAWLRSSGNSRDIKVMNEDDPKILPQKLPFRPKPARHADINDEVQGGMADLQLERGNTDASSRPDRVITSTVVEKDVVNSPTRPETNGAKTHDVVEGYRPKDHNRRKPSSDDDDEDDQDWGI